MSLVFFHPARFRGKDFILCLRVHSPRLCVQVVKTLILGFRYKKEYSEWWEGYGLVGVLG